MTSELATENVNVDKIHEIVFNNNFQGMTKEQRLFYVNKLCEHLGLNPLLAPFQFIELGAGREKKLTLYATKGCAEQLRFNSNVSTRIIEEKEENDMYMVKVEGSLPNGRVDQSIAYLPLVAPERIWDNATNRYKTTGKIVRLSHADLANAKMKCETKAKRRVTFSLCGVPFMDDIDVENIKEQEKLVPVSPEVEKPVSILTSARDTYIALSKKITDSASVDELNANWESIQEDLKQLNQPAANQKLMEIKEKQMTKLSFFDDEKDGA